MTSLDPASAAARQASAVRALVAALRSVQAGPFVISPGSRSTPLVQALAEVPNLTLLPVLDERSAAFVAVGLARAGRKPVVVTTSGSAVAHLLPAWVEAGESALGVGALTADRPVEVRGLGAPQTIWQVGLLQPYAGTVDFDPVGTDMASFGRQLNQAVAQLAGPWQRPWHWNVALDQPLALAPSGSGSDPGPVPTDLDQIGAESATNWPLLHPHPLSSDPIAPPALNERVLVVAGPHLPAERQALSQLLAASSVLCAVELTANVAAGGLRHYDTWLRDPALLKAFRPDRIVRLGHWPVAKGLQLLLEQAQSLGIVVDVIAPGRPSDPLHHARVHTALPACRALCQWPGVDEATPEVVAWRQQWLTLDQTAAQACALPAEEPLHELSLLPGLLQAVPSGARLLLGNSMPIRDADACWNGQLLPFEVYVARGANGIDGTLAQAVGLAVADPTRPVWVYLGDSTFLHDIGTLQLLAQPLPRSAIVVVVADNGGGVIFDYLPAAQVVDPAVHQRFFTVQHSLDLVAVASGFGLPAQRVTTMAGWCTALVNQDPSSQTHVLIAAIDPVVSKQAHQARQSRARAAAIAGMS